MSRFMHARAIGRSVTRVIAALGLVLTGLAAIEIGAAAPASAAVPPVLNDDAAHVTGDPLPTVQIDGVVWDQAVIGNTVYVVGDFDNARPAGADPGENLTPRANVLAYNLTTGALINGFVANTNQQVKTIEPSPDNSRLYIGGNFTTVNGITRYRMAALNPTNGAVITAFNAKVDYTVNALAATATTVYAGGAFNMSSGITRTKLAAFNASNGVLTSWAPSADHTVHALTMSSDGTKVFVGGQFFNLNGSAAYGMGSLDAATGALIPWSANTVLKDGGDNGGILHLFTRGDFIYGNGFTFGRDAGNLEGTFKANANTGVIEWVEDCHGDTYQSFEVSGFVYTASHAHFCGNAGGFPQTDDQHTAWGEYKRHALSFKDAAAGNLRRDNWSYHNLEGLPAPSLMSWFPEWTTGTFTGQGQASWSVEGNANYITFGGEFLSVSGLGTEGLVRFAIPALAPNNEGPRLGGDDWPLKVVSPGTGQIRVSFQANISRDDRDLTYQIQRNNVTINTQVIGSTFWDRPTISFTDVGLTPGTNPSYRIRALDADGNVAVSQSVATTVAAVGAASAYARQVIADDARIYWRLGDAAGSTTVDDAATVQDGTASAMTFGRPGAIVGDLDTAAASDTTSSRIVSPPLINRQDLAERNPAIDELSVETWFRTTSTQGGRLIGFGSGSGSSSTSTSDRVLYVSNSGRVLFGVRTRPEGTGVSSSRERRTIQSNSGLNNGSWHHAVGTLAPDGMKLYIDGVLVASRTDTNSGDGYYGYWKVGADTLSSSWPSVPSSTRLNGDIDEAAVYHRALTASKVLTHWNLSGHGTGNASPTASFTWGATDLEASFDASASTDTDGLIASYDWDFGDGMTGSGVSPDHEYATAGTRTVILTVTDNLGATATTSQPVTVTAPNAPPDASFSLTATDLEIDVDATLSTDGDGNIDTYAWTFGDGGTASGVTAEHTYAAAGTYTVTLTVTDDDDATDVATQQVTVNAPGTPGVYAADAFGRTVSNGFGTADTGGAWTVTGATSGYSVAGGVGRHHLVPGATRRSALAGALAQDVFATVDVTFDGNSTGGGLYSTLSVRRVSSTTYYAARLRANPNSTSLTISRFVNNAETKLLAVEIVGMRVTAGETVRLQMRAVGNGTTTIEAKAWEISGSEPVGWQATTTDSTAALQVAGGVELKTLIPSDVTTPTLIASYDNLLATEP